jgi:DMSO/TMAO reductase YedYZ molybdopterin-dependent catalytic subunit
VTWSGARLAEVLADCRPRPSASYVWSYGADSGEFSGVRIDAFCKHLPLERVSERVLVAFEMNGEPRRPEHIFPVRLVVPRFYGTNSVKWLLRIKLAAERAHVPFTTRWYADPCSMHRARMLRSAPAKAHRTRMSFELK